MSINIDEIEVGYEYQTPGEQDRVVLGYDKDGRVVYASRGGNVRNEYIQRETCSKKRFSEACNQKKEKLTQAKLDRIIENTTAGSILA